MAAGSGQISNIIDVSGIQSDAQLAVNSVKSIETEIDACNAKMVKIQVDLSDVETIKQLTDGIREFRGQMEQTGRVQSENATVTRQINSNNEQFGAGVSSNVVKLGELQAELKLINKQWDDFGRGNKVVDAGFSKRISEIQAQISGLSGSLGKLTPAINEVSGATNNFQINIGKTVISLDTITTQIGRSILRFGAYSIVIGGVTLLFESLVKKMNEVSQAQKDLNDRTKEYEGTLKELRDMEQNVGGVAGANSDKNRLSANGLLELATNTKLLMDARIDGYNKLNELMPQVLKNFTQEQVLNGEATPLIKKKVEEYSKLKGEMDALQGQYELQAKGNNEDVNRQRNQKNLPDAFIVNVGQSQLDYLQKEIDQRQQQLENIIAPIPKEKKEKKEKRPRNLIAYTGEFDDDMARYKTEAEIQKKLVEDTKSSVEERLQANLKYSAALIQIAEAERRKEQEINRVKTLNEVKNAPNGKESLAAKENGKKEEKAIDEKYNTETVKLANESAKRVGEIWASSEEQLIANSKEALEQQLAVIEDGYIQKELLLKQKLKEGLIDEEQYNKDRKKLQKGYNDESIQYEIDFLTNLLKSTDVIIQKHHTEIEKRIRALKKSQLGENVTEHDLPSGALPELEAGAASFRKARDEDDPKMKFRDQLEGISHYTSQAVDIYQQFYAAIKEMRDNAFQQEQLQLDIKLQQVEISSKQQIAAIEATTNYQITKDNEVSKLTAQTAAEENSLQQQQNALKLKQAKADKQAAEGAVILNTAKAITAVLPLFGAVATIPLAVAEIAIITAIGAAQYAAAASTPLPQFWTGGTTETPIFEAGERGKELMITPAGDISMAEKQGIYSAPIGTEIYNAYDTKRILEYAQNHTGNTHAPIIIENNNDLEKFAKMLGDKFEDSMQDMTIAVLKGNSRPIKNNLTINVTNKNHFRR